MIEITLAGMTLITVASVLWKLKAEERNKLQLKPVPVRSQNHRMR